MSEKVNIKKRGEGFKNFLKKYGYFIALGVIVLVVTLSIVLTHRTVETSPDLSLQDRDPVEVGAVALQFGMPLADCSVAWRYSRDEIIKNESMDWYETHKGVDLISSTSQDVLAAESGEVVKVYNDSKEGTVIVIKHSDTISTRYCSLDKNTLVKVGDKVKKGQKIGTTANSNTNELKTGAHLHFEVLENDNQIDPSTYLDFGTNK